MKKTFGVSLVSIIKKELKIELNEKDMYRVNKSFKDALNRVNNN